MKPIVVDPDFFSILLGSAKQHWKFRRHKERWERRYRRPYPITCQAGIWEGVTIIDDQKS